MAKKKKEQSTPRKAHSKKFSTSMPLASTQSSKALGVPTEHDLWFLPLGGSNEIGMNFNLYGTKGKWLLVDLGVTFEDKYGIDVITPDISAILPYQDDIVGLVLTHAHEDHIGAIPYLWPQLRCPLYATPFTATLIRAKLSQYSWGKDVYIKEIPLSGKLDLAPFAIEFVTLTHSIPEPNALAITIPHLEAAGKMKGCILHTGDWKIDPHPLVGKETDVKKLKKIGDKGVHALVCDSTSVFVDGKAGSEQEVREQLWEVIGRYPDKRVTVACFASNVARLETVALAAHHHNRQVALVGRSLYRMVEAAQKNGYLQDLPPFISPEAAMDLPPHKVLFIATGSQGEPRAALSRIASNQHPEVRFSKEDVVLFSSRVIPGNEKSIGAMQNRLAQKDILLVTSSEEDIHVSGHPARGELKKMYEWLRPHILVPVHGEQRHLHEHARYGLSLNIPHAVIPENGTVVDLLAAPPAIIATVHAGRLGIDGKRLISMASEIVFERGRLAAQGCVTVSLVVDENLKVMHPIQMSLLGVSDNEEELNVLLKDVNQSIRGVLKAPKGTLQDVIEQIRAAVRKSVSQLLDKKPLTEVHLFQE